MPKSESDVYMNEWDKKSAAWSRELIKQGYLEGVVDESDIRKLSATNLMGYRQCHFFAGYTIKPNSEGKYLIRSKSA